MTVQINSDFPLLESINDLVSLAFVFVFFPKYRYFEVFIYAARNKGPEVA